MKPQYFHDIVSGKHTAMRNISQIKLLCAALSICIASSFMSGCFSLYGYRRSPIYYVGKFYPPSQAVDVIFDERDVKTLRYEFIGELAWTSYLYQQDQYSLLEKDLKEEAQSRGADAMIVTVVPMFDSSIVRHTVRVRLIKYVAGN